MALPYPNSQNIAIIMFMIISGASARPDVGVLWQNWNENQFSKRLQVKISLGEAKLARPVLKPINLHSGGNSKNRDFPKNISILPQLTGVRTMLGTGSRTEEGSHLDYLKVYRHIAKNRIVKSEMKKANIRASGDREIWYQPTRTKYRRCITCATTAAPISPEILKCSLKVHELFN